MSQLKKHQIVMFPTNQKANIIKGIDINYLTLVENWSGKGNPQHLYILSDEEIKVGDWCLLDQNVGASTGYDIQKCDFADIKNGWYGFGIMKTGRCQKIIATTDKLRLIIKDEFGGIEAQHLPQPSQQFIEKYIESYNKGEIITDVLVEYELQITHDGRINSNTKMWEGLKINHKDNTITIKKVKDSYTKAEVIDITLKSFAAATQALILQKDIDVVYNEFIENNL
jgi:hypothetical protein